jgi:Ca-activated chloride channel family protein
MRALALAGLALACLLSPAARAQWAPIPEHVNIIVPPMPPRPWPGRPDPVRLSGVNLSIGINDQVSTSTLELTLTNPSGAPQEAQVLLPVPDGVAIRSLQYDGVGPEPKAEILPRDEARRIYESIVNRYKDPALVEFVGLNLLKTSVFPVPPNGSQKLRLTYEQLLPLDGNRVDFAMPRSEALAGGQVAWTITADITSKRPIATVYSSSHDIVTERVSATRVRARLTTKSEADRGSFRLSYVTEKPGGDALAATVFAYPSADAGPEGGGYFLLLAAPPATMSEHRPKVKREVILVLDRSGSMRGEKMKQVREAAIQIVRGLEDGEAFNIVDYSDTIASFAEKPVVKDAATAKEAEAYLARLEANGGTNIHDALAEALRTPPTDGMLPIVLFLTDGLPTVGERSETRIREAAKAMNKEHRRLFTFGVGFDVNTPLLVALANNSRAASTFVLPEEDVEVKVSQVYRRLVGPVMAFPALGVAGAPGPVRARPIREVLPAELPDVFEGDQIVVLGQYTGEKPVQLRITGQLAGREVSFDATIDPKAASARNGFVPRIWATRKVAALVDEVRQAGADGVKPEDTRMKELVDEIVRLSTRYGILTEYTAFLAREDVAFAPGAATRLRAEVHENLQHRAVGGRTGAAGVSQQVDVAAKSAAANAPAATGGLYYMAGDDGKEKAVRATNIQQVADRTFFNRSNRWVDSQILDKEGEAPDRTVEFGTEAYFRLAADLAKEDRQSVLAQGGDVYLLVGRERVLVRGPQ